MSDTGDNELPDTFKLYIKEYSEKDLDKDFDLPIGDCIYNQATGEVTFQTTTIQKKRRVLMI